MAVRPVATDWAQAQFGDDAAEVTRRVVRAMVAAHRSGLDAQAASGMSKKFPFGSAWAARFDNLVEELGAMPGAEIVPVPDAPYQLVKLRGKVFIPFRLATTLTVHFSQAKIGSQVLRDLAALSVPRPVPPLTLFDYDAEPGPVPKQRARTEGLRPTVDTDTPIIYIGVVANADSKSLLAAWWGVGEAQDEEGRLTWSPEPLPLDILGADEIPVRVPDPGKPDMIPTFDQGEAPAMTVTVRSRLAQALPGDGLQDTSAAADGRE